MFSKLAQKPTSCGELKIRFSAMDAMTRAGHILNQQFKVVAVGLAVAVIVSRHKEREKRRIEDAVKDAIRHEYNYVN